VTFRVHRPLVIRKVRPHGGSPLPVPPPNSASPAKWPLNEDKGNCDGPFDGELLPNIPTAGRHGGVVEC